MKEDKAGTTRSSPINIVFWCVIVATTISVILLLVNAANDDKLPEKAKQDISADTNLPTALPSNIEERNYTERNSPAQLSPASADEIQLNSFRIAEEQARHMKKELQDNEILPEEERSRLAPNQDAVRAIETGESLIQ